MVQEGAIPIFDHMLRPEELKPLTNQGPIAVDSLRLYQKIQVLLISPLAPVYFWVKVIIPFLSTLLMMSKVESL